MPVKLLFKLIDKICALMSKGASLGSVELLCFRKHRTCRGLTKIVILEAINLKINYDLWSFNAFVHFFLLNNRITIG